MEIDIINQKPITMAKVKESLSNVEKKKKELNFRSTKVLEYLNQQDLLKLKDLDEKKKKLEALEIIRLRGRTIIKILDLIPKDVDALKIILNSEDITLKSEDMNQILKALK